MRKLPHVLGPARRRWVIALASTAGIAALGVAAVPAASAATVTRAAAGPPKIIHASKTVTLHKVGTINLAAAAKAAAATSTAPAGKHTMFLGRPPLQNAGGQRPSASSLAHAAPSAALTTSFAGNVSGAVGFNGQAAAANENTLGFDVTPPDEGMAAGTSSAGTAIVQSLNLTLQVFKPDGTPLSNPIPANDFMSSGVCNGTVFPGGCPSDPRVLWDPQTKHWFLTDFTFNGYVTNTFGQDFQYFAVSQTSDALGLYTVFSFPNDSSVLDQSDCPCVGDFDMVGMDNNGFYIETNEFGQSLYHGANIYAFSKTGLISCANGGSCPTGFQYAVSTNLDPFGAYHLAPSQVTQGSSSPNEYFTESDANDLSNSSLEVFALLGTSSLNSNVAPTLAETSVATEGYSVPPNAAQKAGPIPLGNSLGVTVPTPLQTDFDAVQQTVFANGELYAQLNTGVSASGGAVNAGAAWFALHPTPGTSSVTVANDGNGYVHVNGDILYPSIGVSAHGHGYMAFTISGANNYPTNAYVLFDDDEGAVGPIHIQKAGSFPLDDFSCYPASAGPGCRYGDYSATAAYNSRVYMATEYVHSETNVTGGAQTNWATRIWSAPFPGLIANG